MGKQRQVITEDPHFEDDQVPVLGTRVTYDELGRVATTERLQNLHIGFDPVGTGIRCVFQSADTLTTTYTYYDFANRVDHTVDARGNTTSFFYDGNGRRYRIITTASGRETTQIFGFDANKNQINFHLEVRDVPTTQNPNPTVFRVPADTTKFVTVNQYDDFNRRIETDYPDNTARITRYDDLGRRYEEEDQDEVITHFSYDGLSRLIGVIVPFHRPNDPPDPDETTTAYGYDEVGNMITETNANEMAKSTGQLPTTYQFDKLGRRTQRALPSAPNGHIETWEYDLSGVNSVRHTDFNQTATVMVYDSRGRLATKTPPTGDPSGPVSFAYTASGKRAVMSDASGVTQYSYDNRDRLFTKLTPFGMLTYTYDDNGNVVNIASSNPGGTDVVYEWDEINRLKAVESDSSDRNVKTAYDYDDSGNLRDIRYPNFIHSYFTYNELNRLTDLITLKGRFALADFDYNPSERPIGRAGNRLAAYESISGPSGSVYREVNYFYDHLYRLTKEDVVVPAGNPPEITAGTVIYDSAPGYSDENGYDRVGNRRSRTSNLPGVGSVNSQTFDANDRTTGLQLGSSAPIFSVTYDDNGNTKVEYLPPLVDVPSSPVVPTTASPDLYDSENRLVQRSDGTQMIRITYDGDGNRVRKVVSYGAGTVTTSYLVDDRNPTGYPQVLEEFSTDAPPPGQYHAEQITQTFYTYGHDLISQRQLDGTVSIYGHDGHGNVRFLTDSGGEITDTYTYDAFGILIATTGSTQNNYRYCGEQWDPDLGLYYNRARYFNPNDGRFWTMDRSEGDQTDPLSLHRYRYASADPVNRSDPSGNFDIFTVMAAASIVGVLAQISPPVRGNPFEITTWKNLTVDTVRLAGSEDTLDEDFNEAVKVFEKIKISIKRGPSKVLSEEETKNLVGSFEIEMHKEPGKPSKQELEMTKNQNTKRVTAYYVAGIKSKYDDGDPEGYAMSEPSFKAPPAPSVVLRTKRQLIIGFAHEIGHILWAPEFPGVHFPASEDPGNLMVKGTENLQRGTFLPFQAYQMRKCPLLQEGR